MVKKAKKTCKKKDSKLLARNRALKNLKFLAEECFGIGYDKIDIEETSIGRYLGIKNVCKKYDVKYETAPYGDTPFFNDMHNLFRFVSKRKSINDPIVVMIHKTATELKTVSSYEQCKNIIFVLNLKLMQILMELSVTEPPKKMRGRPRKKIEEEVI